ncbi:DUF3027 domain-containing protein [Streptomyces celluloflavus]|uniref:DUF3027 domain-containing protein n=2 Tax=Streptomyces TaxID=1883 RepID=A0A4Q9HVT0_STRKA|nr:MULTISPECIES: DUF3027 domain-containing protein [Streptomyces]MYU51676.1 DUF3027 domain-containing protein [Streptomyces sp. SID7805]TBO58609.1 DUF3027 domain-containing protein [Streptomyces kasugaensis]WSK14470.1 DUF3027 domain-containing protein [Streptomyces celluloflavus]
MRSRTPDRLCAEAVDLARAAAEETALPGMVGEYIDAVADGDRVVTHLFACNEPGYRGWRWAVTVARASRAKLVTLDETVLLPGPDALLAPEWVPWSERLRPGDLGPGDLLPTEAEDLRLEPGYSGEDVPPPNSVVSESIAEVADVADVEDAEVVPGSPAVQPAPERGGIAAVAEELGMRRARVLSRYGLHIAADRWEEAYGAKTPMAQAAPATCMTCGFLAPLGGSLRQAFGVCANEFAPADGRVVSLDYGCGGHSEAAVMPKPPRRAAPVVDETVVDALSLRPERDGGSVEESGPAEELGHS